ncbi:Sorting nexin-5 [Cichlidogyrus casuarinus]|uniref:Sorting nexin-5 n=1 Tax=Cichlidogyrus casuarinus TaxID=1844966 RepID=A0ABD2QAP5_9PLAT
MTSSNMGGFDIGTEEHDTVALGGDAITPESNKNPVSTVVRSRSQSVLSNSGLSLKVDIPESKSEHDKSNLPEYKPESNVWRQYEEFLWLHQNLLDCASYEGIIIPPAPPRPDFENSRMKLRNLNSLEASVTESELKKMKDDLHEEYIASFKKTVAMHENFLKRLAKHPKIRTDTNLRIFLVHEGDLSVRTQNTKEKAFALLKNLSKTVDESLLLSNQVDNDQFFREEKSNLVQYHKKIKTAASAAESVHKSRVNSTQNMLQTQIAFSDLANSPPASALISANVSEIKLAEKFSSFFEKAQKFESGLAADEDWKLCDTLKYYQRESDAAKLVLYQRSKLLAEYETASKNLDRARERRKDTTLQETVSKLAYEKFENISKSAKEGFFLSVFF